MQLVRVKIKNERRHRNNERMEGEGKLMPEIFWTLPFAHGVPPTGIIMKLEFQQLVGVTRAAF